MARRRGFGWALFLTFVVLPIVEIYVIIQVGRVIGAWWTVILLVADAILGAWLVKREGRRAWQALQETIGTGRMPTKQLADGALVLVGGTLMIAPGFVTDVFGFLCVLPFTRPLMRRLLTAYLAKRVTVAVTGGNGRRPGPGSGPVIQGDVVDR
jgi:UPF0716 protein FxsA